MPTKSAILHQLIATRLTTVTTAITPDINGVENVNLTINSTAARTVTASGMSGVDVLTLTRGDVVVGGATISGNKTHDVNDLDALMSQPLVLPVLHGRCCKPG